MARRTNSSSDDDGGGDYSRRHTDRKLSKPIRRHRTPSPSGSESPSRISSSDSDIKRRRKRGSELGNKKIEDTKQERVKKLKKKRYDSSSDDSKEDGEIEDVGRGEKEEKGEKLNLGREKEKNFDSGDSGSDDSRRVVDRRRKESGREDRKKSGGDDEEEGGQKRNLGREKEKEKDYNSESGSDDSRKVVDRRKENGRDDTEPTSRRDKEMDGRKKREGDDEGERKLRERDDEKRVERHRTGRGKDESRDSRDNKGFEKGSRRNLEDEDENDDRKERGLINGRDEKKRGRRDDGREDRDDYRKERRSDRDDDRRERRSDRDDDRKERRSDRDDDRRERRSDRDDDRKERRSDRDRGRRGNDDERDHRRRSDGEDRRNVRTEVERDNKSGREREGDGNVSEDPRVQRPEVNLNVNMANTGRSGGVYIPPFKLARMMKEVDDKSSVEYQRMTWDALRKSINGLVNKVNSTNAKNIIPELFAENLIRGRGLFCRSCMKSQMASPGFTDVFAALVAVVNSKFPEVGDLLIRRIILQLQRAFKRNDKPLLLAVVKFIAHLVNQQVVHELIALELLTLLLRDPTDDSVEVAVGFVTECGSMLQDLSPKGLHAIFERFRGILHEGEIDKRVQFLIEGLFALRKAKFQNYPAVRPELDLVELEDQITHEISLSAEIDSETSLDIFNADPHFLENEKRYEDLKKQILGEESEDDDEESGAESDDDDSEEESDEDDEEQMQIKDETETNLVNLRRTIYLTIMSSVDFEEAGHKLLKIKLEPGQEMELCIMLLECCSQERTYLRYYGLLGQRFCMINKVHQENFEKCFVQQYSMIHRLETNKLRNVAKFFAHLLGTDALPWHVLAYIRLTEEDTTSSSRIFIKILFQELSEHLGIRLLNDRLNEPTMQESLDSIFPKDNPKNTRFAINFFTSIGLGGITENLREYLKNMPRLIMQQQKPPESEEESGSETSGSGSSSSSSSSSDESDSESERDDRRKRRRRR